MNNENVPASMIRFLLDHGGFSFESLSCELSRLTGKEIETRNIISILKGFFSVKTWLFIPILKLALKAGWIPNSNAQWVVIHTKVIGRKRNMSDINVSELFIKLAEICEFSEQIAFNAFNKCKEHR